MEEDFETLTEQYQREKAEGAEAERMTALLTEISRISYDERLLYELALWHWKAGYPARAKRVLKQLRQYFGNGEWSERAAEALALLNDDEELPEELEARWLAAQPEDGESQNGKARSEEAQNEEAQNAETRNRGARNKGTQNKGAQNGEAQNGKPRNGEAGGRPGAAGDMEGREASGKPGISGKTGKRAGAAARGEAEAAGKTGAAAGGQQAAKIQEAPEASPDADPELPAVIAEAFAGMVGMESVKKELVSFYNIARLERLREKELGISGNDTRSYNFVLYGNPGTGKTTVARIIGKVLYSLGIREKDTFMEVDRSRLVSEYVGQTARNVQKAVSEIRGGTLFIDEAYSLYKKGDEKDFGQEAIDTLLKDMEDHRSEYSVILAGYRGPMTEMLNHANPGFRSRFTYHIVIPDYSDEELLVIAKNLAAAHHYRIEEDGLEALKRRIDRERIDETFGNARFIREVINDAEKNLANRLVKMGTFSRGDLTLLKAEDIFPDERGEKDLAALLAELNGLTGLAEVKESVSELLDKIAVQKEAERRGIQAGGGIGTLHMAFKGSAGTGKTTVARLLGKILAELGILKRGDVFVEVTRADLIGQYQGHTAAKVRDVVRSALGGVLFIDEAYALVRDANDSFGHEAVDTLVAEMENHRDALVVILAGYTEDIDRFLTENQGLRSRVTRDLYFADYTVDEMTQIFFSCVSGAGLRAAVDLLPAVQERIAAAAAAPDFGNARGVRNLFEAACRKKDKRLAARLRNGETLLDTAFVTLEAEDLQ